EDEIRQRLVLAMVNEAARALSDRIVKRAGDVDLAMIMGTGFPPFRGGLLRWADSVGADQLVAQLHDLAARGGNRFAPAPLLTPPLVVLREGEAAERELARRVGARIVVNPAPEAGPITSIRCALDHLPRGTGGIAVLPVDHPLVEPATVEELLAAFDAHPEASV